MDWQRGRFYIPQDDLLKFGGFRGTDRGMSDWCGVAAGRWRVMSAGVIFFSYRCWRGSPLASELKEAYRFGTPYDCVGGAVDFAETGRVPIRFSLAQRPVLR